MYYKITNKESEVYKKLHEMRTNELKIDSENMQAIKDKIGLEFSAYLGPSGQQHFFRVPVFNGFKFDNPDMVDLDVWRPNKFYPQCFEPNLKTKAGRAMSDFLRNDLKVSHIQAPLDILGFEHIGSCNFPFIEIKGDVIVLYLDSKMEPEDQNVVEITKKEFEQILNS